MKKLLPFCVGTPDCFVFVEHELFIVLHLVEKFNQNLAVRVGKRTELVVGANFFIIVLAVFGLVSARMVELFDLVVGFWAVLVGTSSSIRTLNMRISDFFRVPTPVTFSMVEAATT